MLHRHIKYSCTYAARMSPALNGSLALQRFKHGNAMKIHNGTMFDFYPALPHILPDWFFVVVNTSVHV